jgi:metal-responsive CopG/Arc/MetJ family transcriptional regulator
MKSDKTDFVERISVVFPKGLLAEIDRLAKDRGRTRSGQIRFFLRNVVRRSKTKTRKAD